MVVFPNCKINLGLSIINKRSDGYHNLETIFYPLALKDVLEIIPAVDGTDSRFTSTGLQIDGDSRQNLCWQAYQLLLRDFPALGSIRMHLHKAIPMGAGLGGGSADGSFVLRLLNTQFNLGLTQEQLLHYALRLGSDCPFFILNTPSYATGRGEQLEPVSVYLQEYDIVIVNPGIGINTGWAFSQLQLLPPRKNAPGDLKAIMRQPVSEWRHLLHNDFEEPVFSSYPEIAAIRDTLYAQGATFAAMTGSGSTVFGLFIKHGLPSFIFPDHYLVIKIPA